MMHIVFNEADVEVLQKAIGLDSDLDGEVLLIRDDYAVGPLGEIYSAEGIAQRRNWWAEVLAGGDYEGLVAEGRVDDPAAVRGIRERLSENPEENCWIWVAQNKHDVCGYYWLISQLQDFQGRVYILFLNNLPFINEKGHLFYPQWLSHIPPREFLKARKLARPVTLSEMETDPDEWRRICLDDRGVRLLEGGKKLVQAGYDFYDRDLEKFVTPEWQKGSKVIHQFLSRNQHTTGDAYLLWRIRLLAAGGLWDVQGELKHMKDFELKQKISSGQTVPAPGLA